MSIPWKSGSVFNFSLYASFQCACKQEPHVKTFAEYFSRQPTSARIRGEEVVSCTTSGFGAHVSRNIFFKTLKKNPEVQLTCGVIFVSGVQHTDPSVPAISQWSLQKMVTIQNYLFLFF